MVGITGCQYFEIMPLLLLLGLIFLSYIGTRVVTKPMRFGESVWLLSYREGSLWFVGNCLVVYPLIRDSSNSISFS
ncbi:hypothetical protein QL093DRAFT_2235097 [Fusarium oxysporum]|nr:hypothetical protein QL093DRAFT_2235097 [Fusarium oxysporum]